MMIFFPIKMQHARSWTSAVTCKLIKPHESVKRLNLQQLMDLGSALKMYQGNYTTDMCTVSPYSEIGRWVWATKIWRGFEPTIFISLLITAPRKIYEWHTGSSHPEHMVNFLLIKNYPEPWMCFKIAIFLCRDRILSWDPESSNFQLVEFLKI